MKKKVWLRKLFCLGELLLRGNAEQKDEYSRRQTEKGSYYITMVILVLGMAMSIFYMNDTKINRTQFAAVFYTLFTLFAAGRVFVACTMGTLPVTDRYGGRFVFFLGAVVIFEHCSLVLPARYHFGRSLIFWDMGIAGVILYYLACNGAWRSWESYQKSLDAAAEENCREEEQRAKMYRAVKNAAAGILLLAVIGVPAVLGFRVYDTEVMEEVKERAELSEDAKKTPEYLEYEEYQNVWQEPETYAMVYKTPLEARFDGEKSGPSYEEAGVLYIHTKSSDMTLLFVPRDNGAKLLRGVYYASETESTGEAEHLYVGDKWYTREEWMVKQSEPGFSVEEVENYEFTGGQKHFPGIKGLGTISKTEEAECIRYKMTFSQDYLEETDKRLQKVLGISRTTLSECETLLVDENKIPVEQQYCRRERRVQKVNFVTKETDTAEWWTARYYTREEAETEQLLESCLGQNFVIPAEVVDIYSSMSGITAE